MTPLWQWSEQQFLTLNNTFRRLSRNRMMATIPIPQQAKITTGPLPDIKDLPEIAPAGDYIHSVEEVVGFNEIRKARTAEVNSFMTVDLRSGSAIAITSPGIVILGSVHPEADEKNIHDMMMMLVATKRGLANDGHFKKQPWAILVGASIKDDENEDTFFHADLCEEFVNTMSDAGYPVDYRRYPIADNDEHGIVAFFHSTVDEPNIKVYAHDREITIYE
ncbi:hypothetical protein T310_2104 [Rasamsonia emersonii CBS 393.64]|uniref:Uncharacterized protein n=1 Tax=Rasamsonia emersonii (strain ATCC 16479 / CBS 393.64 / IMI 116815) TaxID=1408163 RepID=A0A0F4Z1Y4_RASE3|nr:hypothetical protein T310_2104 [Rasamsonia emersonii CBS 393.64]KKA23873.1 hypothetical protein T310_2104 [Rasamsonia emersonii CBS 393.64]